jgi:hypothetical protein
MVWRGDKEADADVESVERRQIDLTKRTEEFSERITRESVCQSVEFDGRVLGDN